MRKYFPYDTNPRIPKDLENGTSRIVQVGGPVSNSHSPPDHPANSCPSPATDRNRVCISDPIQKFTLQTLKVFGWMILLRGKFREVVVM